MSGDQKSVENLENNSLYQQWEFIAIYSFCSTFHIQLGLHSFDCDELEQALFRPKESFFIKELHMKLIQGISDERKAKKIRLSSWEEHLRSFVKSNRSIGFVEESLLRWANSDPKESSSYADLPLRVRVLLLHQLCEYQLERNEAILEALPEEKVLSIEKYRVVPLGRDAENNIYWYFNDFKLYRETENRSKPLDESSLTGFKEEAKNALESNSMNVDIAECMSNDHMTDNPSTINGCHLPMECDTRQEVKKRTIRSSHSNRTRNCNGNSNESRKNERTPKKNSCITGDTSMVPKTPSSLRSVPRKSSKGPKFRCPDPPEPPGSWTLICRCLAEWKALAESFRLSRHRDERQFYDVLVQEILPVISHKVLSKERAETRQLLYDLAPKKRSDRLLEKQVKLEEIERKRQEVLKKSRMKALEMMQLRQAEYLKRKSQERAFRVERRHDVPISLAEQSYMRQQRYQQRALAFEKNSPDQLNVLPPKNEHPPHQSHVPASKRDNHSHQPPIRPQRSRPHPPRDDMFLYEEDLDELLGSSGAKEPPEPPNKWDSETYVRTRAGRVVQCPQRFLHAERTLLQEKEDYEEDEENRPPKRPVRTGRYVRDMEDAFDIRERYPSARKVKQRVLKQEDSEADEMEEDSNENEDEEWKGEKKRFSCKRQSSMRNYDLSKRNNSSYRSSLRQQQKQMTETNNLIIPNLSPDHSIIPERTKILL